MKTSLCVVVIWFVFFIVGLSSVQCQTQEFEGYTIVRTVTGPQVCLGRWVPPRDVSMSGVCEGQMVAVGQLSAISARQSVDRLDQLLLALSSIDQKLAVNNDQINRLIEATVNTQASIDQQVRQVSEFLRETITERFDGLPKEILANDVFRKELNKLKEDILKEVEKHYPTKPAPSPRPTPSPR